MAGMAPVADTHPRGQVKGKYDIVQIDYSTDTKETEDALQQAAATKRTVALPASRLDASLQSLMQLLFDVKAMTAAVRVFVASVVVVVSVLVASVVVVAYETTSHRVVLCAHWPD